jgi:O-antigen biosynthesis protein
MRVLFASGIDGDTRRYRCDHHQEQLALAGIESVLREADDPHLYADAALCDLLILHRAPMTPLLHDVITLAHLRNIPVLFETDDLVFQPERYEQIGLLETLSAQDARRLREDLAGLAQTFARCDHVLVTTEFLAGAATALGKPATVHRNSCSAEMLEIGQDAYAQQQARRQAQAKGAKAEVVIGYFSGTGSHNRDFRTVTPVLIDLLRRYPQVVLHLSGHLNIDLAFTPFAGRIRRAPYVSWRELPYIVAQVDINLAPLELDNPFCQAKSEIKWSEAAMVGVPTVATGTEAFRHAIIDGETGMLAGEPAAWEAALVRLIEEPEARWSMGDRARDHVYRSYTPQQRSRELVAAIEKIVAAFAWPGAEPATAAAFVAQRLLATVKVLEERVTQQQTQLAQLRQTLAQWEAQPTKHFWQRELERSEGLITDELRTVLQRLQKGQG